MTDIHTIQRLIDRRKELRKHSTIQENILWQELRNSKLGFKFKRQHSIGGYIADFYCAKFRLVIEIDGLSHGVEDQKEYDHVRDSYLTELNHKVLRFRNDEIDNNLIVGIKKIRKILDTAQPLA